MERVYSIVAAHLNDQVDLAEPATAQPFLLTYRVDGVEELGYGGAAWLHLHAAEQRHLLHTSIDYGIPKQAVTMLASLKLPCMSEGPHLP